MKRALDMSLFAARHGPLATYAFTVLAFVMPLMPRATPLCLMAGVLGLVLHHRMWTKRPSCSGMWRTPMPWAFMLYLLHVVGVAWSTNMDYAGFDLQIKLPLVLLPLVHLWMPRAGAESWRELLLPFIWGNVLAVVIALVSLAGRLSMNPALDAANEVFGERFSWLVHPSYFALYLTVALAAVLLRPAGTPLVRTATAAALCLGVLLCGSKAGWIGLGLVLSIVLVVKWRDNGLRNAMLGLATVSLLGLVTLVAASPNVRERVLEAWQGMSGGGAQPDASTSTEVRKLAWHSAAEVAREHAPWGTGTGDVKDELMAMHERSGYIHLLEKRINAHSQYLQLWAALGVAGLVLTILLVSVPLVSRIRARDALGAIFFLLAGLNWVVESMLEVQVGVLFFSFFAFVLAQHEPRSTTIVKFP